MSSLMSIQGQEMRIVNYIYQKSIKKFVGPDVEKYKNELAEVGLIALLEFIKDNKIDLATYVFENELQSAVANAMQREIANIKKNKQNKAISLSTKSTMRENSTVEDCIPDKKSYFDSYDLDFLKQQINSIMALYSQNEQKILQAYFFENENKKTVFCKNFNIKYQDLRDLVRDYRKKLKFKLQIQGYTDIEQYSLTSDEFTLKKHYVDAKQRKQQAKQDIQLFNVGDFKIYKLIRTNGNLEQFANLLKIPVEQLNNTIQHKCRAHKLFLYQIQALRQKFFSGYSLTDLVQCEELCCI